MFVNIVFIKASMKSIFVTKNRPQITPFAFVKKRCAENESRDILNFSEFVVSKTVLHSKFINKTRTKTDLENSVHCFGDNHLVKFLQNRIKSYRVGTLKVRTGYQYFLKNR